MWENYSKTLNEKKLPYCCSFLPTLRTGGLFSSLSLHIVYVVLVLVQFPIIFQKVLLCE